MAHYRINAHRRPWGKRYTIELVADNGEPVGDVFTTLDHAVEGCGAIHRAAAAAINIKLPDGRERPVDAV